MLEINASATIDLSHNMDKSLFTFGYGLIGLDLMLAFSFQQSHPTQSFKITRSFVIFFSK